MMNRQSSKQIRQVNDMVEYIKLWISKGIADVISSLVIIVIVIILIFIVQYILNRK